MAKRDRRSQLGQMSEANHGATSSETALTAVGHLSDRIKRQMSNLSIHDAWESEYRTHGNQQLFERAFDYVVTILNQPSGSTALDIGCGICANAVRMARRGYQVSAADYSESILEQAERNVQQERLEDRISIGQEDILNLSFPANHFDCVLCWGVLMHIPDVVRAISELMRVAKRGGYIVLEEISMRAPEAALMRLYWRLSRSKEIKITKTPAGFEHICVFASETLFWRHVNVRWLNNQFCRESCEIVERGCSMFTELYRFMPARVLMWPFYAWNNFWLHFINIPHVAMHNIFIFRKT